MIVLAALAAGGIAEYVAIVAAFLASFGLIFTAVTRWVPVGWWPGGEHEEHSHDA